MMNPFFQLVILLAGASEDERLAPVRAGKAVLEAAAEVPRLHRIEQLFQERDRASHASEHEIARKALRSARWTIRRLHPHFRDFYQHRWHLHNGYRLMMLAVDADTDQGQAGLMKDAIKAFGPATNHDATRFAAQYYAARLHYSLASYWRAYNLRSSTGRAKRERDRNARLLGDIVKATTHDGHPKAQAIEDLARRYNNHRDARATPDPPPPPRWADYGPAPQLDVQITRPLRPGRSPHWRVVWR